MKLPRDISGPELVALLKPLGYEVVRQTGSHARLASQTGPTEHHITIPLHSSIRVGTLSSILRQVAAHLAISQEELVERLFGR